MLTLKDCIDLCNLRKVEVETIVAQEYAPDIIAMKYSQHLIESSDRKPRIKAIIRNAEKRGDKGRTVKLTLELKHFVETHGGAGAA